MAPKALAIEAYLAGHTAVEAARIAGLMPSTVRTYICRCGISRPVGRPRKAA
jgi:DNA-directed RNA polymerase specialized sigma24 family protein